MVEGIFWLFYRKDVILLATTQTKTRGKGKNPPVAEVRAENEKLKAEKGIKSDEVTDATEY